MQQPTEERPLGELSLSNPSAELTEVLPAEVDDLVRRYLAGARLAELSRHFGVHEQTVRADLQRRQVELRGKQALSAAKIRSVVKRYEAGESSLDLGIAFGMADHTIRNVPPSAWGRAAAAELPHRRLVEPISGRSAFDLAILRCWPKT